MGRTARLSKMSADFLDESLVDSLRLAAAAPEQQISALPDFVSVTDEVGTTFGSAYLLVPQLEEFGRISADAAIALKRLDDFFEAMPKDVSAPGSYGPRYAGWQQMR
jgi:hypothetical protein